MSMYKIMMEGHEGVASVEEQVFCYVQADSETEALQYAAKFDPSIERCESWQCYLYGARKLFAVKHEE